MAHLRSASTNLFPLMTLSAVLLLLLPGAGAQTPDHSLFALSGQVTAVQAQESFQIDFRKWVHITPQTSFAWYGDSSVRNKPASAANIVIGLHVEVTGRTDGKTLTAGAVHLENPEDRQVKGFGVVESVVQGGAEPVYEADGYRIQFTASTVTEFSGSLKKLAEVKPGTWIHYDGWRNPAGEVVTLRARFSEELTGDKSPEAVKRQRSRPEAIPADAKSIDATGKFVNGHTKVRMSDAGGPCGWHRMVPDSALQARLWRVGMQVVPAFQKKMAANAAARIPYRFYAVEEPDIRSAFGCADGLVLVPKQVVARLKTDDQLAAVLADGVAAYLQAQAFRLSPEKYLWWSVDAGETAAEFASPWGALAVTGTNMVIDHESMKRAVDQRGRMALTLMADAGYDPWAAPEAWRLLAPKKLPANLNSLEYPQRSKYQLLLLKEQYGQPAVGQTSSSLAP